MTLATQAIAVLVFLVVFVLLNHRINHIRGLMLRHMELTQKVFTTEGKLTEDYTLLRMQWAAFIETLPPKHQNRIAGRLEKAK